MDINTSKNIAFSLFTFSPVIGLGIVTIVILLILAFFNKKKVNYKVVTAACFKAILYQFFFLIVVLAIGYILLIAGRIKIIPLILILPVSTIVSFVSFGVALNKKKRHMFV